jgi:hypothetical protein
MAELDYVLKDGFLQTSSANGSQRVPSTHLYNKFVFVVTISGFARVYLRWGYPGKNIHIENRNCMGTEILTQTGTISFVGVTPYLIVEWADNTGTVTVDYIAEVVAGTERLKIGGRNLKRRYGGRSIVLGKRQDRYTKVYPTRRKPNI